MSTGASGVKPITLACAALLLAGAVALAQDARVSINWDNGNSFEGPAYDGDVKHAGYGIWMLKSGEKIIVAGDVPQFFDARGNEVIGELTPPKHVPPFAGFNLPSDARTLIPKQPGGYVKSVIGYLITPQGSVTDVHLIQPTGIKSLDEALAKNPEAQHFEAARMGQTAVSFPYVVSSCYSIGSVTGTCGPAAPLPRISVKWDNGDSFEGPGYDNIYAHMNYGTWTSATGEKIAVDDKAVHLFDAKGTEIVGRMAEPKLIGNLVAPTEDAKKLIPPTVKIALVIVGFVVMRDGTVIDTRVVQSSGNPALDTFIKDVAGGFHFTPARMGETPVNALQGYKFCYSTLVPSACRVL